MSTSSSTCLPLLTPSSHSTSASSLILCSLATLQTRKRLVTLLWLPSSSAWRPSVAAPLMPWIQLRCERPLSTPTQGRSTSLHCGCSTSPPLARGHRASPPSAQGHSTLSPCGRGTSSPPAQGHRALPPSAQGRNTLLPRGCGTLPLSVRGQRAVAPGCGKAGVLRVLLHGGPVAGPLRHTSGRGRRTCPWQHRPIVVSRPHYYEGRACARDGVYPSSQHS